MLRRLVIAAALAATIVTLGVWLSDSWSERPPVAILDAAEPTPPDARRHAPKPARRGVTVTAVRGEVQRQTGGAWSAVGEGDTLAPDDLIRTGPDGYVDLTVDDSVVAMEPETQLFVVSLTAAVSEVRLRQGRVEASVPGTGAALGVAIAGGDGHAETERGKFAVLSAGEGEAAVAVTEGEVEVESNRVAVTVGKGKQTRIRPGKPPSEPTEIPASLFIKVHAYQNVVRTRKFTLEGTTTPGAVIRINGLRVQVDDDGAFAAPLELEEGENTLDLEGSDVLGRREATTESVLVDSQGPRVKGKVKWGQQR